MLSIKNLPRELSFSECHPEFQPLAKYLRDAEALAQGPDRSTSFDILAAQLAPLFAADDKSLVLVVKLPSYAESHIEVLLTAEPGLQTYGAHLAERRVCLAFSSEGAEATLHVDVQHLFDELYETSLGQTHLVLAIACAGRLHFRLLDDALREHDPDDYGSQLQAAFFSADNYKPQREYSLDELSASFDEYEARRTLLEDSSILTFCPLSLRTNPQS